MGEYYGKYSEREERMLKQLFGRSSREEKVFHLLNNLKIAPNHRNETKLQVACNDVVFCLCARSPPRAVLKMHLRNKFALQKKWNT